MKKLSDLFYRLATRWAVLAAWLGFLLFAITVLPAQNASATPAERAAGIPDLMFYYNADDLYRMAAAYGEEARVAFIRGHFTFDVIWPVIYTLFLIFAISRPASAVFPPHSRWRRANLLPLAAALFDLLENTSTSLVMQQYPARLPLIAALAGFFTALKWLLVTLNFGVLVFVLAAWAWKRSKTTRQ